MTRHFEDRLLRAYVNGKLDEDDYDYLLATFTAIATSNSTEITMTNEERVQEAIASQDIGVTPSSADAFGQRAKRFDILVAEYKAVCELFNQIETEKKDLNDKLKTFFIDSDIKSVLSSDGAKVTLVQNKGRSTIDKTRLIEAGVPASIIAECTVTGEPFSFVNVTHAK